MVKIKRLIMTTLGIIIVCAAINVVVITANSYSNEEDSDTAMRTYIIKEYNGMVAGFEEDSDYPFLVTDTKVIDLPPTDRKMLSSGVEVVGAKAFSRAMEDYRS